MKKKHLFSITGAVAAAVLVLAACPQPSNSGGDTETLRLSGDVYTQKLDSDNPLSLTEISKYSGSQTVNSNLNVDGTISRGKLSFITGAPAAEYLQDIDAGMLPFGITDSADLRISPSGAKGTVLRLQTDSEEFLLKRKINISGGLLKPMLISKSVSYIYVDRDVRLAADGDVEDPDTGITIVCNNIDLQCRKGWNAVCLETSMPVSLFVDSIAAGASITVSASIGDPGNLNWVLTDLLSLESPGGTEF